jgi:ribosomal-protein-alanine N-acetyltransferase
MGLSTRFAETAEARALADIHATAFDHPWGEAEFADLLARPEVFALIVEGGFILMRAAAGESEVMTLAVAPSCRRQGAGRALLEAAMVQAEARAADAVFLEVAADNDPAIALYRSAGFEQVGRRKGYYAHPDGAKDALVLRRDLLSPHA